MSRPLDDLYFEWLYSQTCVVRNRNPRTSYWNLNRLLFSTEFVWIVDHDRNRMDDGLELRDEFLIETGFDLEPDWRELGCSVLEMLIALARRAAFQTGRDQVYWFGEFLHNLGLEGFNDSRWTKGVEETSSEVIENFVYRNYESHGAGGVFPLRHPHIDQTKLELWYQMAEYICENEY